MKKILLIDDQAPFHYLWMWGLRDRFVFIHAFTIQDGRLHFEENPDVSAIVMDACMNGPRRIGLRVPVREWGFNTRELIMELKSQFAGPIIASPCQWWHFRPMLNAGCTHYAWKWRVSCLLLKLLKQ